MNPSTKTVASVSSLTIFLVLGLQACVVIPSAGGEDGDILITDDPCMAACEEREDSCESGGVFDCESVCDSVDQADCSAELESFESCRRAEGEICETPASCEDESAALLECVSAYCEANPDAEGNLFCF